MEKQLQPYERWAKLKATHPDPSQVKSVKLVMDEIEAIDNATPWQATEPKWWLEMIEYSRHLATSNK
jgi:hypothetical protein